jgi:predicted outer membrane repeat protein
MTSAARLATVLFVTFMLSLCATSAFAGKPITVGDGSPGSCTEMALQHAANIAETAGGGTIRFKCGKEPVSIGLTDTFVFPTNTTVDGDDLITLRGNYTTTVTLVAAGTTVVLKGLTITGGYKVGSDDDRGGGIINRGALVLQHVTVLYNLALNWGGGILNEGDLTIDESTIYGNNAFYGGAGIMSTNGSSLVIRKSTFEYNTTGYFGGAIYGGPFIIDQSTFSENYADGVGGAILGSGKISRSTFTENRSYFGGAIYGGDLAIDKSTFSGNTALYGGAIYSGGTLTLDKSTVTENTASFGGGLLLRGETTIDHSTITHNTAWFTGGGGDIYRCVADVTWPYCGVDATLTFTHTVVDDLFPVQ